MAKFTVKNGLTSVILRVRIPDTTSVTGAGKTGLTFSSAGLIISTIADNESGATTYTQAGSTIETITTLGTFAAPTASKCRFKEVDATNHPGLYEIQIADARWAVSSARSIIISLPPVSGLGTGAVFAEVQLTAVDFQDAVRFGLTALPNAAAEAAGGLFTRGTGAGQINQEDNGFISVNLKAILRTTLTETSGQIAAGFKKLFDVASPVFTLLSLNQTGDSFARLGTPAGASIAADIAAAKVDTAAIKAKTDSLTFTVANQIDSNVLDWKGATAPAMTGDSYARLGAPAGASIAADVASVQADTDNMQTRLPAALVGGRMDSSVGANQVGVDFTAAMKTSLNAATPASVSGAVGSVSGNVGGNIVGSVGSLAAQAQTDVETALTAQGYTTARAAKLDNADVATSTRLATSSYTSPDNADIALIKAKTDNLPAAPASEGNVTAVGNAVVNIPALVWAYITEGSFTALQIMRLMSSALLGKASGAATPTMTFRDLADTKDRIVATVDLNGDRSVVTLDGS